MSSKGGSKGEEDIQIRFRRLESLTGFKVSFSGFQGEVSEGVSDACKSVLGYFK